jgi:hypothetical protein
LSPDAIVVARLRKGCRGQIFDWKTKLLPEAS